MGKNIINEFNSIKQASEYTGINRSLICNCCYGKGQTCGGYRWSYKDNYDPNNFNIPISEQKVYQLDKDEKIVNIYKNISEASKQTGIYLSGISACVNGKRKTAGGYIWRRY